MPEKENTNPIGEDAATETAEEESTIFSAPISHNDTAKQSKKPLLKRAIAAALAVLVLAGGTVAVIKLIPKKEKEPEKSLDTVSVISTNAADVDCVEINNEFGKIVMRPAVTETDGESDIVWSLDGIDASLTDSALISNTADRALNVTAIKEIADAGNFGLNNSTVNATVKMKSGKGENYSVILGDEAPAGLGIYIKVTATNKVYLADASIATYLNGEITDFASTEPCGAVPKNGTTESCFNENSIIKFDSIVATGKKIKGTVKIVMQTDDSINSYFAYKITSPTTRIADNDKTEALLTLFASGIASSGAYSYKTDAAALKKYGLNNPDVTVTLTLNDKKFSFSAAKVDDTYCAVTDGNKKMIYKVENSLLSVLDYAENDFYSTFIFLENLSGLNGLKVEIAGGKTYNFGLKYTPAATEGGTDTYFASFGGKEIDIDNFKKFYQYLIGLTPIDYEFKNIKKADLTITLSHSSGTKATVLEFKKYSEQRYQVELDGVPMGKISAADLEKIKSYTEKAATNTQIA